MNAFAKITLLVLFVTNNGLAQLNTEFEPGAIWNDTEGNVINAHGGGILKHLDTYYWFGEIKENNASGAALKGVSCYSSKDLYNWKNESIALKVIQDTTSLLQAGCTIERPKVIYNAKTKKFVMWFHHELKGRGYAAALAGCAVADTITGPYTYLFSKRINAGVWPVGTSKKMKRDTIQDKNLKKWSEEWKKAVVNGLFLRRDFKGGQMSRDMTLFVDDDKKGYLITASEENQTLHFHELSKDYLGFTGKFYRVFPGGQNEGPAIFKKDGVYYMFTSGLTGWKPNPGKSAKAKSIAGEWVALGNPCRGTDEENKTTFWSQSTFVLPIEGKYIFLADRWKSDDLKDSRYIWLPIEFEQGKPILKWQDRWKIK
jgi:beta-xylosidase